MARRTSDSEDELKARLGRRIRELREERGMAQDECAHVCGVSRVYLGSIERGDQAPTIAILDRISRGLDVPVAELLNDVVGRRGRSNPLSPARAFTERLMGYASGATEDELRRFERIARAFFGLSVARKAEDGRPKVRKTGFSRRKRQQP